MNKDICLNITGRTVKSVNGIRPFQREVFSALEDQYRLITVEAPVGSGKSYIIRNVVDTSNFSDRPVLLTYPTKILMQAQVRELKKQYPKIKHWPNDPEEYGEVTLFEYSTDALVRHLKKNPELQRLDRSEIISNTLLSHQFCSRKNLIVTTPDVLHLIKRGIYRQSKRLASLLNGTIVFFDEFHLYTNLYNFAPLIEWLLDTLGAKVILLSATPTTSEELQDIKNHYSVKDISFDSSVGGEKDVTFNYPLKLTVTSCNYTKRNNLLKVLSYYLPDIDKPCAIIFDSVFRLMHLKSSLMNQFPEISFYEYSGMQKEKIIFNDNTVVLGTASIEVGIEMPIKSLITEAAYWTSAIQRIGRAGRTEPGAVILLTKMNLVPFIQDRSVLSRDEFEKEILQSALKDSIGRMVSGEMFRGDSYPFLIVDTEYREAFSYTEAVFSMYDIDDTNYCDDWQTMTRGEKREYLADDCRLTKNQIEDILIRDMLVPFWGVVAGRLKEKYEKVTVKSTDDELIVCSGPSGTEKTYYFERGH